MRSRTRGGADRSELVAEEGALAEAVRTVAINVQLERAPGGLLRLLLRIEHVPALELS